MKSNVLPRLIGKFCNHPGQNGMSEKGWESESECPYDSRWLIPSKRYGPSQIFEALALVGDSCRHYWSTFCVLLYVSSTFGAISNIFQAHSRNLQNDVLEKKWNHLLEWVPHLMTVVEIPVWPAELMNCLLMDWIYATIAAIMHVDSYCWWFRAPQESPGM